MRRILIYLTLITLAVVLSAAQAKPAPKVTMAAAKQTALAKHAGKIKGAELENEDGRWVYSIDIKTATELREVQVDANSGEIVSDKVETAEDEAKEKAEEKSKKKTSPKK